LKELRALWLRWPARSKRDATGRGDASTLDGRALENDRDVLASRLRAIIGVMIAHDLYHAGEINHLRALRQGNDQWEHDNAQWEP